MNPDTLPAMKKLRTQARGGVTRCTTVIRDIETILPNCEPGSMEERSAQRHLAWWVRQRDAAIEFRDGIEDFVTRAEAGEFDEDTDVFLHRIQSDE